MGAVGRGGWRGPGLPFWSGWGLAALAGLLAGCSESDSGGGQGAAPGRAAMPLAAAPAEAPAGGAGAGVGLTGSVRVEALGCGRRWQFSHGGSDGLVGTTDDRVRTGELVLPGNTDVEIQLRSRDFIYVFSCPELNLKEIAVPDLEFTLSFRTGRPGRHELAMDPMCGFPAAPGETMGVLRVVSPQEFSDWSGGSVHGPG